MNYLSKKLIEYATCLGIAASAILGSYCTGHFSGYRQGYQAGKVYNAEHYEQELQRIWDASRTPERDAKQLQMLKSLFIKVGAIKPATLEATVTKK